MLAAAAMTGPLLAWPATMARWLRWAAVAPRARAALPFLLDAADQVHLVVHGQAEEHGEDQDRQERVDWPRSRQA